MLSLRVFIAAKMGFALPLKRHFQTPTVTSSSQQPTCFDIKSAHLSLVAVMFKTLDTSAIAAEFNQRFADFPDFFDQDAVALDLSAAVDECTNVSDIDWPVWLKMLKTFNMIPLAVRGVPESWKAELATHNLVWMASQASLTKQAVAQDKETANAAMPAVMSPTEALPPAAMVVNKPLRSGQRVYAKGGDLVVMAMVNAGAEVIADCHIDVYAPLRGRAIAGARGDTSARVFALTFEPELVSIAGVYQSIDDDLPAGVRGAAAQVSLQVQEGQERLIYQAISR